MGKGIRSEEGKVVEQWGIGNDSREARDSRRQWKQIEIVDKLQLNAIKKD